jgi:hypothetical protein
VKFTQALDAVQHDPDRLDSLVAQDVSQWVGHVPAGAFYPAVESQQRFDVRTCEVFTQQATFVEINAALIAQVSSQVGVDQYRFATARYMTAMPIPEFFSDWFSRATANNLTLITQHNARYWGLESLAALCTTTTTTTLPPCPCAGNHPDMRVTVSGIQSTNYTPCTLTNDSFCTALNRTWCLLFRGFDYSFNGSIGKIWYRDQYIPVCYWEGSITYGVCIFGGLTYSSARVRLTYPTPPWGATDSCNFARLNVGDAANYMSSDFNPDTGGTFTLESTSNLCSGVPTSLTVTVQASCTTTTSTTSTTSTTGPP